MKPILVLAAIAAFVVPSGQDGRRGFPTRARCRQAAAGQAWGRDLRQIPSTVIDSGALRDIPYSSYRSGGYELNVYGDPLAPAAVEIGLHGALLKGDEGRRNALAFATGLFDDPADRGALASLKLQTGKTVRDGLTFEITPPEAPDAYGGWWISVYDEKLLDRSRATPEELAKITTTRDEVKRAPEGAKADGPQPEGATAGRWSAEDLAEARRRKDVAEEKQPVYKPVISRKDGTYVPDRTVEDTGLILFICANSDRHEDREEILKTCPACSKESTFFWDLEGKFFRCFQCGEPYDNARLKCTICGKVPLRVRTKHR